MIMFSLAHPTHAPMLLAVSEGLEMINRMASEGVVIHVVDFNAPDGSHVIAFWSLTGTGTVGTVWEYTMRYLTNVPFTAEVRQVQAQEYALQDAQNAPQGADGYSVGE